MIDDLYWFEPEKWDTHGPQGECYMSKLGEAMSQVWAWSEVTCMDLKIPCYVSELKRSEVTRLDRKGRAACLSLEEVRLHSGISKGRLYMSPKKFILEPSYRLSIDSTNLFKKVIIDLPRKSFIYEENHHSRISSRDQSFSIYQEIY